MTMRMLRHGQGLPGPFEPELSLPVILSSERQYQHLPASVAELAAGRQPGRPVRDDREFSVSFSVLSSVHLA